MRVSRLRRPMRRSARDLHFSSGQSHFFQAPHHRPQSTTLRASTLRPRAAAEAASPAVEPRLRPRPEPRLSREGPAHDHAGFQAADRQAAGPPGEVRRPDAGLRRGAGIEGASTMRKQELMFAILNSWPRATSEIMGAGVLEVLPTASASCAPESNYLAGPDDIYVSPRRSAASPAHRRHGRGPDPLAPRTASAISPSSKVNISTI